MRNPFLTIWLLGALMGPMPLLAQPTPGASPDAGNAAERGRISAERREAEAAYARAQAGCYGKFAVNDCLNEAKARRREAMSDLRRQEISLNDQERRHKGAAQRQRLDDKASPQNQQRLAEARAQALQAQAARAQRADDKAGRRGGAAPAEAAGSAALSPAEREAAKLAARGRREAEANAQVEKRRQRIKEARERRDKLESQQNARAKPPAKPLPVPP